MKPVYKIPERHVQEYLKLNNLKIVVDFAKLLTSDIVIRNLSGIEIDYQVLDKINNEIMKKYFNEDPIYKEHADVFTEKIKQSYYVIINAIKKINELSNAKYGTKFIPVFDPKRLKCEEYETDG